MRLPHFHPFSILKRLAVAYLLICLFMWGYQRHLLYMPQTNIRTPEAYGLHDFVNLRLESSEGIHVQAWRRDAMAGYPTIVYFHGNGGHLGGRAHYYKLLSDAGFGVLALGYRGYGSSEGSPSEQGFYDDARAIMRYATGTIALKPNQIILYGESLGTGVAVQMATEFPIGALVLQAPYTSIADLAQDNYPWLPTGLLLKDRFDSLGKISRVQAPILLFHGERDTIIPLHFGKTLFANAPEPKEAVYMPDTDHNDFDLRTLTGLLLDFSRKYTLIHSQ